MPRTSANALLKISQLKTLERASGKATVLSSRRSRHIIRCLLLLPVLCVLNVYDFTYLYRYIATCIHHVHAFIEHDYCMH